MGNDRKKTRQKPDIHARHGSKRADHCPRPIDRQAPGIPAELVTLYDTGKMGTPEHRAQVAKEIDKILEQYPWLERSEALMINIQRGISKVSMRGSNTSGGGRHQRYRDFLKRKYGKDSY